MNQHRTALRWFAALLTTGAIAVVSIAPAQAATDHNSSAAASYRPSRIHPMDTGWNGT
jgi:hypothetical protein